MAPTLNLRCRCAYWLSESHSWVTYVVLLAAVAIVTALISRLVRCCCRQCKRGCQEWVCCWCCPRGNNGNGGGRGPRSSGRKGFEEVHLVVGPDGNLANPLLAEVHD